MIGNKTLCSEKGLFFREINSIRKFEVSTSNPTSNLSVKNSSNWNNCVDVSKNYQNVTFHV